jgi:hypothetical protein
LLLRSGAAGFTCAHVRVMIGRPRPLPGYPTAPALYPISVRRLRTPPPASFPPRLAATQLPSACDSHHQGSQRTSTSCINAMPGTQSEDRGSDPRSSCSTSECASRHVLGSDPTCRNGPQLRGRALPNIGGHSIGRNEGDAQLTGSLLRRRAVVMRLHKIRAGRAAKPCAIAQAHGPAVRSIGGPFPWRNNRET